MRIGELIRLKVEDPDLEKSAITIRPYNSSKKSRPRTVPLGQVAKNAIWKHMAKNDRKEDKPLFTAKASSIRSMLRRLGKRVEPDNVYPHRFRHTFAIEFLKNGGDIYTLKYILGHSSLNMVEKYLNIARMDKDEVHKRASPADRWLGRGEY